MSPVLFGVADFWASRVTQRPDGSFGIYGVTGPDEYAVNVNNSVYTNAAAKISLEFAVNVSTILKVDGVDSGKWESIAAGMYIPFDSVLGIHPEYDGYRGGKIKQADVVLLSYPVGLEFSEAVRLNDIRYYAKRTDVNGPCMTDGVHTIALLDLGKPSEAATFWPKSFANAQAPFWVWQETPQGGAINFITGAGGFLQAIVFGYGGLRIQSDQLRWRPQLPPSTAGLKVRGVAYLTSQFDLAWNSTTATISAWPTSAAISVRGATSFRVSPGSSLSVPLPSMLYLSVAED